MAVRKPLVLVSGRPTELAAADTLPASAIPGKTLVLLGTYSIGESTLVTLGLSVRRYTVTISGLATTDNILVVNNGIPSNGSLQDSYVSATNTLSVGALIPVLGVASTVAIGIAVYRIT